MAFNLGFFKKKKKIEPSIPYGGSGASRESLYPSTDRMSSESLVYRHNSDDSKTIIDGMSIVGTIGLIDALTDSSSCTPDISSSFDSSSSCDTGSSFDPGGGSFGGGGSSSDW